MATLSEATIGAKDWNRGHSRSNSGDGAAAAQVWRCDFLLIPEESEFERSMRATADAVHAHKALRFAPRNSADRIVTALAIEKASIALVATGCVFVEAKDGPARNRSEQRAGASP